MHGYEQFFEDVKKSFSNIINFRNPIFKYYTDENAGNYSVEIILNNSKILLDLDRMDLQVKIINLNDLKEYYVIDILTILYPKINFNLTGVSPPNTRKFIIENLQLYDKATHNYLDKVLNGDFSWSMTYETYKNHQRDLIKKVMQLNYNDIIYQKFLKGDSSWKIDIENNE